MAAVPIRWNKTWSQPSYLVEMRSRTGFSGSAVYIYIDPSHAGQIVNRPATYDTTTNVKFSVPRICGPWLLGVHWAQLPVSGPDATEAERTEPKSYASGVSAVVPGQILKRFLLEDEQLKRERKVIEDEWKSRPHAVLETAAEVAPPTDNPSHKEDFTRL